MLDACIQYQVLFLNQYINPFKLDTSRPFREDNSNIQR